MKTAAEYPNKNKTIPYKKKLKKARKNKGDN